MLCQPGILGGHSYQTFIRLSNRELHPVLLYSPWFYFFAVKFLMSIALYFTGKRPTWVAHFISPHATAQQVHTQLLRKTQQL